MISIHTMPIQNISAGYYISLHHSNNTRPSTQHINTPHPHTPNHSHHISITLPLHTTHHSHHTTTPPHHSPCTPHVHHTCVTCLRVRADMSSPSKASTITCPSLARKSGWTAKVLFRVNVPPLMPYPY